MDFRRDSNFIDVTVCDLARRRTALAVSEQQVDSATWKEERHSLPIIYHRNDLEVTPTRSENQKPNLYGQEERPGTSGKWLVSVLASKIHPSGIHSGLQRGLKHISASFAQRIVSNFQLEPFASG